MLKHQPKRTPSLQNLPTPNCCRHFNYEARVYYRQDTRYSIFADRRWDKGWRAGKGGTCQNWTLKATHRRRRREHRVRDARGPRSAETPIDKPCTHYCRQIHTCTCESITQRPCCVIVLKLELLILALPRYVIITSSLELIMVFAY